MTKFYEDGVTIISLCTLIIGFMAMICKQCYKSKCSNINILYGLIHIKRNVEIENEIETDIIPNKV